MQSLRVGEEMLRGGVLITALFASALASAQSSRQARSEGSELSAVRAKYRKAQGKVSATRKPSQVGTLRPRTLPIPSVAPPSFTPSIPQYLLSPVSLPQRLQFGTRSVAAPFPSFAEPSRGSLDGLAQFKTPNFGDLAQGNNSGPGGNGSGGGGGGGSPSGGAGNHKSPLDELKQRAEDERRRQEALNREIAPGDFFRNDPRFGNGEAPILPQGLGRLEGFAPPTSLLPAGANGNPGFNYKAALPGGVYEGCAATLVSTAENVCRAATAAHCLFDSLKVAGHTPSHLTQSGMFESKAHITTKDFGQIEVKTFLEPSYVASDAEKRRKMRSGQPGDLDAAFFAWPCDASKVTVPVVPLATGHQPQNGEYVMYGKVMAGRHGLYGARISLSEGWINNRPDGEARINTIQTPEANGTTNLDGADRSIQQGDSGGGLFTKNSNGDLLLIGVLSTSMSKNPPRGGGENRNYPRQGQYTAGVGLEGIRRGTQLSAAQLGVEPFRLEVAQDAAPGLPPGDAIAQDVVQPGDVSNPL